MKNRIYRPPVPLKKILRAVLLILLALLAAAAALFFLFRSWTVYDAEGAHIVFPRIFEQRGPG
ncbi:MAG: hypothetical protein J5827_01845 [Oscillospiraceae bacterium]|nr:hypothetical protein [Oscillospiraceae bacterium]